MSKSGNTSLASQDPGPSLPSPSPSTSSLQDVSTAFLDPPQNTPRAMIALIRDTIVSARAAKKHPTVDAYAKILSTLDSLDRVLGDGDHIESTLKAFKLDLIAEITATTLRLPASYASAASAPAPPSRPSPAPSPSKTAAAKSCEVTILLDKACDVLSLPLPEIKAKVETAIAATGAEKLKGVTLRGVKVLPRNRLLVAVDSDRVASLLKQSAAHWVPRLARNSSLIVPRCQIVVNGVPTSFNPSSPTAAQELYARNRSAFADPSVIAEIRWLNPKVVRDPKKKASSLLVTITDVLSADLSIAQGLAIESTICYPHRYEEPPLSCFNCQQYGHAQYQCKQTSPTCARCSGPHRSSNCPCSTSSTKCAPNKRCDHFSPRCVNCKGKHPTYYKECPVRIKERELQSQRLQGRIFFDPNFDPFSSSRDDPSPLFFEPPPPRTPTPPSQ